MDEINSAQKLVLLEDLANGQKGYVVSTKIQGNPDSKRASRYFILDGMKLVISDSPRGLGGKIVKIPKGYQKDPLSYAHERAVGYLVGLGEGLLIPRLRQYDQSKPRRRRDPDQGELFVLEHESEN